jgi:hypothetical protein
MLYPLMRKNSIVPPYSSCSRHESSGQADLPGGQEVEQEERQ